MSFVGFERLDIIITNREFLDWVNNVHRPDIPHGIHDFEYPYYGEPVIDVIETFITQEFSLDSYDAEVKLLERDNVEFPQRVRFLAKSMVRFSTEKEFNRYKISEAKSYSKLCKIQNDPVLVNPDYGSC